MNREQNPQYYKEIEFQNVPLDGNTGITPQWHNTCNCSKMHFIKTSPIKIKQKK